MPKYQVVFTRMMTVSVEVAARDEEAATEKAASRLETVDVVLEYPVLGGTPDVEDEGQWVFEEIHDM